MMRRLNVNYGRTNSAILLLTPTPAALGTLLLPAGCSGSGSDLRRLRRPYYDRRFHRLPHPLRFLILHGPGQLKLREGRGRRARGSLQPLRTVYPECASSLLAPEARARPRRRPTAPQQGEEEFHSPWRPGTHLLQAGVKCPEPRTEAL